MRNRRTLLLALVSGLVALGVIVGPAIADELLGTITKVDVSAKKLTVQSKGGEETIITVTDNTKQVTKGESTKVDLEKIAENVKKSQEAGKKGMFAKITHEKGVASEISGGMAKKGMGKKKAE